MVVLDCAGGVRLALADAVEDADVAFAQADAAVQVGVLVLVLEDGVVFQVELLALEGVDEVFQAELPVLEEANVLFQVGALALEEAEVVFQIGMLEEAEAEDGCVCDLDAVDVLLDVGNELLPEPLSALALSCCFFSAISARLRLISS